MVFRQNMGVGWFRRRKERRDFEDFAREIEEGIRKEEEAAAITAVVDKYVPTVNTTGDPKERVVHALTLRKVLEAVPALREGTENDPKRSAHFTGLVAELEMASSLLGADEMKRLGAVAERRVEGMLAELKDPRRSDAWGKEMQRGLRERYGADFYLKPGYWVVGDSEE